MVSALTEVMIGMVDLAKAELRQGRSSVVQLVLAVALLLASVFIGATGVVLLLAAIMLGLMQTMPTPMALGLTAMVALGCAGVLGWIVHDLLKS
ncbi:hypothetical protein HED60_21885 [Planctomycetales bacterium ZRK34]|nr:hypothetical protein HED60_21885 [Planctomycetales bacterium ZRK34]